MGKFLAAITHKGEPMTIQGLITKVQEEKPNTFTNNKILSFINEIETEVAEQLIEDDFMPYTGITDAGGNNIVLLAPAPYDRLYVSYVKAMIDYANEEYASYQLNAEQHSQDFRDFVNWVVREHVAVESLVPSRFRNIW